MRVRVDPDLCQGHGMCHMTAPALFQIRDEDGHAYVLSEQVPAEGEADARLAAQSCPEQAIGVDS